MTSDSPSQGTGRTEQANSATERYRILCVEDDEAARVVLTAALRDFAPRFATTGSEAIRVLHAETFDAFVLDLWLPDYNGIPLCREIRAHDPNVPIVMWTVADKEELQGRAMRAGANAFLRKGPDYEILQETLRRLIAEADTRAIGAYTIAQDVLDDLKQRYRESAGYSAQSPEAASTSLGRLAHARVLTAYLGAGGTRSRFEKWWQGSLGSGL
jgi:DNA-binding response OmpR family regulator